ncbi:MAG: type II secretion system protein [Phycisphaerales bacterium]|nr:type II secretion system protein [Phycisphaerales bacterium]
MRNAIHQPLKSRSGVQGAFTLIELLVVVAIIAILMSMLLPALHGARERAKQVYCRNNIRNIWTGVLTYGLENRDRMPFAEDVNLTDPTADPFDEHYRTTVGVVLKPYVNPDSWVCPSAVAGFPNNVGDGSWKMTYTFSSAGAIGTGIPYDRNPAANSGGVFDPAVSNYVHFDGRPMNLLDGRRYVQRVGLNRDYRGTWTVRRAIIAEAVRNEAPNGGIGYVYPHRGTLEKRDDLFAAREQFEANSNSAEGQAKTGYFELHAEGEDVKVYFTRSWEAHLPGY